MNPPDFLCRMKGFCDQPAVIYNDESYSYGWLVNKIHDYLIVLDKYILPGDVVQLVSDYTPEGLSIFIALMLKGVVISPLTNLPIAVIENYAQITHAVLRITVQQNQSVIYQRLQTSEEGHPLLSILRQKNHSGLIIMSSGSSGKSKAILHDMLPLLSKVKQTKNKLNVLSFLLFDHIGGINSLLNTLYSGNTLIVPHSRTVESVTFAVEHHHVNVLITSPSFLNLMFVRGVFIHHDFPSLKQINYGSEVMPSSLLIKLNEALPHIKLTQAYGLSELGVLKTRSEDSSSLKIKIEDNSISYRVRDGKLEIYSSASMLGYLNAPSPFTEDGWFKTGDVVVMDGEYLHLLGRDSDMINVGGEKVFPTEVEDTLLKMPEVIDVTVCGMPHAILGNIVVATVILNQPVTLSEYIKRMRLFCNTRLPAFKIPQKVVLVKNLDYGHRFKKMRRAQASELVKAA